MEQSATFSKSRTASIFLLILGITIFRAPDALYNPQFWAEDATEWFDDAYHQGAISLFNLYGGYLNIFQRLVAILSVKVLPLSYIPIAFNIVAILIGSSSLFLFTTPRFRHVIKTDELRLVLCLIAAFGYPSGEITNTLTNTHWFLTLGSLILLVFQAESGLGKALVSIYLAVATFTAPLNFFLLPIAVYLLFKSKNNRTTSLIFICSVIAHICILPSSSTAPREFPGIVTLFTASLDFVRVLFLVTLSGYRASHYINSYYPQLSTGFAFLLTLGLLLSTFLLSNGKEKAWIIILFVVFSAIIGSSMYLRQDAIGYIPSKAFLAFERPSHAAYNHGRYLFIPYIFLLLLIGTILDRTLSENYKHASLLSCGVLGWLIVIAIFETPRFGPLPNLNWSKYARQIENGWSGIVPINPTSWGWYVEIQKSPKKNVGNVVSSSLIDELVKKPSAYLNIRMIEVEGKMKKAMFLHPPETASISSILNRRYLTFSYGLDPRAFAQSNGVRFAVDLSCDQEQQEVFSSTVVPNEDEKIWHRKYIDLEICSGKSSTITFRIDSLGDTGYDWALWIEPEFTDSIRE